MAAVVRWRDQGYGCRYKFIVVLFLFSLDSWWRPLCRCFIVGYVAASFLLSWCSSTACSNGERWTPIPTKGIAPRWALRAPVLRDGCLMQTGGEVNDIAVASALNKWPSTALLLRRVFFSVPWVILLQCCKWRHSGKTFRVNKPSRVWWSGSSVFVTHLSTMLITVGTPTLEIPALPMFRSLFGRAVNSKLWPIRHWGGDTRSHP